MFRIEMLPAQRGDALWLTYGTAADPHHVLIDAGPSNTIPEIVPELERRIRGLGRGKNRVELFVITHIDADHVQGAVALLSDPARVPLFRDVWFNGWKHVSETLGGMDAERLTASLEQHPEHWNRAFDGHAVRIPDTGPLPVVTLRGGLRLTVLAPTDAALRALAPKWEAEVRKAGLVPGAGAPVTRRSWIRDELLGGFEPDLLAETRFSSDSSIPNCSGIALIAEFEGKRILLLGDSPPGPILAALDRLGPRPHRFHAVKTAHHGSRRNTSLAFAEAVQSPRWLISTNGAIFGHPDPEALARIIVSQRRRPTFICNYDTEHIADIVAGAGERYAVRVPRRRADGTAAEGITVTL